MRNIAFTLLLLSAGCTTPQHIEPVNESATVFESIIDCDGCYVTDDGRIVVTLDFVKYSNKLKMNYAKAFWPPLTDYYAGFTPLHPESRPEDSTLFIVHPKHVENMEIMLQWWKDRRAGVLEPTVPMGSPPPVPGAEYSSKVVVVPELVRMPQPEAYQPLSPDELRSLYWELQHIKRYYPDQYYGTLEDPRYHQAVEFMRSIGELEE